MLIVFLSRTALGYTVSLISESRSSWRYHSSLQWQPWADHCLLWDQKGSKWTGYECFAQTGTGIWMESSSYGYAGVECPEINMRLQLCGWNFCGWF